jgi:hypothetical protein
VLRCSLPYVSDDFKVVIVTDASFAKEINELAAAGVLDLDTSIPEFTNDDCQDWLKLHLTLVMNLDLKAKKIPKLVSDGKLEDFKLSIIGHYLRGQNVLEDFGERFPSIYGKLNTCKQIYQNQLETVSLFESEVPSRHLNNALNEYSHHIEKTCPNLPPSTVKILAWEAVSDWLMRCPLDF